ncbi:MAG: MGMT family protein [Candidatus Micrarchaeota archaeon]|nr:MGMT family protein [Candidatus Micrarchaeota archaeon]
MSDFRRKVFEAVMLIPKGKVSTYKAIAEFAGNFKAYRAVGNILNKNPYPIKVPCHRVIRSDGTIGGYVNGSSEKAKLLKKEGISVTKGKIMEKDRIMRRLR